MSHIQPYRVGRATQAMLLAGVALSGSLVGCAHASDLAAHATRLSAAQDSDVLAPPSERVYSVSDLELSPSQMLAGVTLPESITPSGYFIVGDGIITDAWFEASFGDPGSDHASASFRLTEPTVLRRIHGPDSSITAVGTLTFGGVNRPDTSVQFSVVSLDKDSAELLVLVTPPANVLEVGGNNAEIAARISFDVQ